MRHRAASTRPRDDVSGGARAAVGQSDATAKEPQGRVRRKVVAPVEALRRYTIKIAGVIAVEIYLVSHPIYSIVECIF